MNDTKRVKELISYLESEIKTSIICGHDKNDRSYEHATGVLLSQNEAIEIVEFLKAQAIK